MDEQESVMCNFSKGIKEEGITKGILTAIKNLMETMGLSIEQAMAALKIPEADRQKYVELLNEKS